MLTKQNVLDMYIYGISLNAYELYGMLLASGTLRVVHARYNVRGH